MNTWTWTPYIQSHFAILIHIRAKIDGKRNFNNVCWKFSVWITMNLYLYLYPNRVIITIYLDPRKPRVKRSVCRAPWLGRVARARHILFSVWRGGSCGQELSRAPLLQLQAAGTLDQGSQVLLFADLVIFYLPVLTGTVTLDTRVSYKLHPKFCSSRSRIPDPDLDLLPTPDPGSRGEKGSRIRHTGYYINWHICNMWTWVWRFSQLVCVNTVMCLPLPLTVGNKRKEGGP